MLHIRRRDRRKMLTSALLAQSLEATIFPSKSSSASVLRSTTKAQATLSSTSSSTSSPEKAASERLDQGINEMVDDADAALFDPLAKASALARSRALRARQGSRSRGAQTTVNVATPATALSENVLLLQGAGPSGLVVSPPVVRTAAMTPSTAVSSSRSSSLIGGLSGGLGGGGGGGGSGGGDVGGALMSPMGEAYTPVDYYIRDKHPLAYATSFYRSFHERRSRPFLRALALASVDRDFLARVLQQQMQGQAWWLTVGSNPLTDAQTDRLALYDLESAKPLSGPTFGLSRDPVLMSRRERALMQVRRATAAATVQQRAWTRAARLANAAGFRVRADAAFLDENNEDDEDDEDEIERREREEEAALGRHFTAAEREERRLRRAEEQAERAAERARKRDRRVIMAAAGAAVRVVSNAARSALHTDMTTADVSALLRRKKREAEARAKTGVYDVGSTVTAGILKDREERERESALKSKSSSSTTLMSHECGGSVPDPFQRASEALSRELGCGVDVTATGFIDGDLEVDVDAEDEEALAKGGYSSLMIRLGIHRLGPAEGVFNLLAHWRGLVLHEHTLLPVRAKDRSNSTALHIAAERGSATLCLLLCERRADPGQRNDTSLTPADVALKGGHLEALLVLLRYGGWVSREAAIAYTQPPPPPASVAASAPLSTYLRRLLFLGQPVPDYPTEATGGARGASVQPRAYGAGGMPELIATSSSTSSSSGGNGVKIQANKAWDSHVHWQGKRRSRNMDELVRSLTRPCHVIHLSIILLNHAFIAISFCILII